MQITEYAELAIKRLNKCGFKAYLVGGCLRDTLLGHIPYDYDITTDALPDETKDCFFDFNVIETGLKHGTVTVVIEGNPIEITTMRTDGEYLDGRHPENVCFTRELKEDLSRRDFTVNALAYEPNEGIIDCFGGMKDLKDGIIRAVGNAEKRFNEDALRILRALRFSSKLGFEIETETAKAVHDLKGLLENISAERIFGEFKGIIGGKNAEKVLTDFADVICEFIPELRLCIGFNQNNPHHIYDVYTHTVKAMNELDTTELKLTAFFHDIAKPLCKTEDEKGIFHFYGHPEKSAEIAKNVLRRLKCDNKTRDKVVTLIKFHDYRFPPTEKNVKRLIYKIGYQNTYDLIKLKRADLYAQAPEYRNEEEALNEIIKIADRLKAESACLSINDLAVNGKDIMSLGLKGKEIGRIKKELLSLVIDGEIDNEKNALLKKVREMEN